MDRTRRLNGLAADLRTADGLLLVDKPEGPTSHDAVEAVRRELGGIRAGHAGTLDPFASGLLVVALGRATRLLRFLSATAKTYEGEILLGVATDTDDRTGKPLPNALRVGEDPDPARPTDGAIEEAITALSGEIDQIPPLYSARKHEGVRLYRLARAGLQVPRSPARAFVTWRSVERRSADRLSFVVTVSAGTYVRALARDLGERLGCGAHLLTLRRTTSGAFSVADATPPSTGRDALLAAVQPIDSIPLGMRTIAIDEETARQVRNGRTFAIPDGEAGGAERSGPEWVRLVDRADRLVAIAEIERPDGSSPEAVHPRIVFH
jgi:tRNA pseudouridine55 synthase